MPRSRSFHVLGFLVTPLALAGACNGDDALPEAPPHRAPLGLRLETLVASLAAPEPALPTEHGFLVRAALPKARALLAPALRAELGASAAEPLRLVATPGGAVTVHRRGAAPAAGRINGASVVYENVQPGVDSIVFSTRAGVEELVVARRSGASMAYDLDLPPGYRLHRSAVPGLVEVLDETSTARLRLWVKRAWDAGGHDVPVEPIVEESGRIRVALDETAVAAWPVVIDPEWTLAAEMTTARYQHTATTLADGRVLFAGGDASKQGFTEIYDPRTSTFTSSRPMSMRRAGHTATLLGNGKVLITGGSSVSDPALGGQDVTDTAELFDPVTGTFAAVGKLRGPRSRHTATLLTGDRILLAGGLDAAGAPRADAEVYDGKALEAGTQSIALSVGRTGHAAVLLNSGRVALACGGYPGDGNIDSAAQASLDVVNPDAPSAAPESVVAVTPRSGPSATLLPSGEVLITGGGPTSVDVFNPLNGTITTTPSVSDPGATAVRLPSGRVLLAGGTDSNGHGPTLDGVVLVDPRGPATRTLAPMKERREGATATLLASGLVLLAGGYDRAPGTATASAEIYDPEEARLESTGSMLAPRHHHTMTRLPSGEVLVVGGRYAGGLSGAEVFNPSTQVFRAVGPMVKPRDSHTATLVTPAPGMKPVVVVAGGFDSGNDPLADVENYDPATEWFSPAPKLLYARAAHGAVVMPDDSLFLAGGPHPYTELRKPDGTATPGGTDTDVRLSATVTGLGDGSVLVFGGRSPDPGSDAIGSAMLFNGTTATPILPKPAALALQTATRLDDGKVLIAGGHHSLLPGTKPTSDVLLFNPKSGMLDAQPALGNARSSHTATLLPDGKTVLFVGGESQSAELYDTTNGSTPIMSPIPQAISEHAAILLPGPSPQVLITGGGASDGTSAMAVRYDVGAKTFSTPTEHAREWHSATLLADGKLLLAGGFQGAAGEATASADLFDPRLRTFASVPAKSAMSEARLAHTATLLPDGDVLVAGGLPGQYDGATPSTTFETWKSDHFEPGGKLDGARAYHAATLLAGGHVLLTGGSHASKLLASAEIIDPQTGMSSPTTGPMSHARYRHASVRLPSGRVLIAGGITLDSDHPYDGVPVATAEIYDPIAGTFTDVAGPAPVPRDTRAVVLPSGEVLIVGDQIAYRFDEATGEMSVAGNAPDWAFGAAVLPGGRLLLCGVTRCDTGTEAGLGTAPVLDGAQRDGHTLTALPGGEAFAAGLTPTYAQHTFSYRAFPPEAPRPAIDMAPSKLGIGASITMKGERFQHLSARGTAPGLLAQPQILPRVLFVPAASGAPVTATLTAWSDTSITFTAPRTPYTGGGWLVVIVDGVASEGVWTELAPTDTGGACGFDTECSTEHCAAGVCCDYACNDSCHSCFASKNGLGADGTCGPISIQGQPSPDCHCTSSFDCPAGFVCSAEGRCDAAGSPGPDAPSCAAARESRGASKGEGEIGAVVALLGLVAARRRRDQKV